MAQGQLPLKPGMGSGDTLMAEETHQIQQCEKLVRFRDEVVSGVHPRIKPAHPHLASKPTAPSSSNLPTPASSAPTTTQSPHNTVNGNGHVVYNMRSFQENLQRPPVTMPPHDHSEGADYAAALARQFGSSKAEINPILLEKSDDLIKAEIRLQRVRLERGLREQVEQRRTSTKASLQAPEPLADFGLADVLSKALALVQSTAAAQPTDETAANASASSDSFDDNTFYSSQHDTPEPPTTSGIPNGSEDELMRDSSPYEPELDPPPVAQAQPQPAPTVDLEPSNQPHATSLSQQNASTVPPQSSRPGANRESNIQNGQSTIIRIPGLQTIQAAEVAGNWDRGEASHLGAYRNMDEQQRGERRGPEANQQLMGQAFAQQTSPVIRAHNLSPIAPQPAHVSPLAVARQPPVVQQQEPQARRATPPQVAALRKGPSAATSPEGSPQGNKAADKKKPKKKKRKAEKQAAEASVASPFIKAEPRSPSPLAGLADARPTKRQRQTQRQHDELSHDEPRYEQPVPIDDGYRERYQPRGYRDERGLVQNDRQGDLQFRHEAQPVVVAAPRYDREYYEERPPTGPQFARPLSAAAYPVEYGSAGAVRVVQPVSNAGPERPYRDSPAQYRDMREAPRMSARLGMDGERSRSPILYERPMSVMPPPRAPPTRIFMDEFGREYLEPPRPPAVARQSVAPTAPTARVGESEAIYERAAAPRAVSRRPDSFEDNGILYRRASPPYMPQRRVVTQPEFAGPEYRAYREREYSTRPIAPPGDGYAPSRARAESRLVAESPREYIARAPGGGGRPVIGEGIRYEPPGSYGRGVGGEADRDLGARAASARPTEAPRYEAPQGYERRVMEPQYLRAASVRPAEPMRYEYAREYGARVGSVRPDIPGREYAASIHPEGRREVIQPPAEGHAFGVPPVETGLPIARPEYRLRPAETYYERPLLRGGEEIVYMDSSARPDAYHQAQMGRQ